MRMMYYSLFILLPLIGLGTLLYKKKNIYDPFLLMEQNDHISSLSTEQYAQPGLREADVIKRVSPRIKSEIEERGLNWGAEVFIRIFKESRELEMWLREKKSGKFLLFKTWKIKAMSGNLGPKLYEGDFQAPEGFYYVPPSHMHPGSKFHLAFNIGYPNIYDRIHERTGSHIMVHGSHFSSGCFAMTNPYIEEIYTLCKKALGKGQKFFRIHIFPFRMSEERLAKERENQWYEFWKNLKEGHDWFEINNYPPNVSVKAEKYIFDSE